MRHIALVSPNYHPRTCGVGDNSARLAAELMGRGVSPVVLSRAPAEPHPSAPGVPVVGFPDEGPSSVVKAILRWIEAHRVEEVILQYTSQMFGASRFGTWANARLVNALRARRIAVTLLAHELYIPWSARPDLLIGAMTQRLQFAACARHVTRLAVTTATRIALLKRWVPLVSGAPRIRLVPVGPPIAPLPWSPASNGFLLGTFSTLGAGRRHDVVLDAFARIIRDVPDAELWLLGDLFVRDDVATRDFRLALSNHPAGQRVRTPGKQSLPDLAAALSSLHVFLHPMDTGANTRSSTLSLALGTGLPVIATHGAETDDLFQSGKNVLFAHSLSGQAFADAALRLRREPELARALGRGARELYSSRLNWSSIVDALLG